MKFSSVEEELKFLRSVVLVNRMADEILEDCLERHLGLTAALDVFLTQCARLVHARAGFARLRGTQGPVLTRSLGILGVEMEVAEVARGPVPLSGDRTLIAQPLTLGSLQLGAFGLVFAGRFDDGGELMSALVETMAEQLDSAVLGFLALSDGRGPLERLDEVSATTAFRPRGRIGRYELLTPLGTGGMAQVMVARARGPEGLGRLVALKRMLPHLCADEEMVKAFLDEARIGLRLAHPNLVTFYDVGEAGGAYYIAMELVRGATLGQLEVVHPQGLPPALASTTVTQLLEGLEAAHELRGEDGSWLGLVHRDISPQNVMVGFDGQVKVLDFGVAKVRSQRAITVAGIVKGKPLYMSPEQATGQDVDRRTDIFAAGLVLYQALCGRHPFYSDDDVAAMQAIVDAPLERDERIPIQVWPVLERALAKAPQDRFDTAHQMSQALAEALPRCSEYSLGQAVAMAFPERLKEITEWEQLNAPDAFGIENEPTRIKSA